MIDYELPALKDNFLSSEKVLPLARYFVEQIRKDKQQNTTDDYSFAPTKEFLDLIVDDDNRETIQGIMDKYYLTSVRLHCRPALSITDTHFDGGHTPTFGVCLAGSKIWSIKEASYWDLLTLHYGAISKPSCHHTLDSMLFDRSIWFHDKPDSVIAQRDGDLIYLPPGWYHTVVYAEDIISFSITLTPKNEPLKLRGKPASFFYSPPSRYKYNGSKSQWIMVGLLHHGMHFINHILRVFMFPAWTLLACIVSVVRLNRWVLTKFFNAKALMVNKIKKIFGKSKLIKHVTSSEMKTPQSMRERDQIVLNSLLKFIQKEENTNEASAK
ncbi:MAG: hypothetical protein HRT38_03255 [Alteromonadaceae bacterium]|nr:hypothetical protein [Alteromonadaceae bacterium]